MTATAPCRAALREAPAESPPGGQARWPGQKHGRVAAHESGRPDVHCGRLWEYRLIVLPDPTLSRLGPPPKGPRWAFEVTWDAFRAIVSTEGELASTGVAV